MYAKPTGSVIHLTHEILSFCFGDQVTILHVLLVRMVLST